MTPQFTIPAFGQLGGLIAIFFAAAMLLLHILFAVCLANDTARLRDQGRPAIVLSPFVWTLAALVLGLIAVAFYWLCHYSTFSRTDKPTGGEH